jgi:hypothetical protein
MALVFSEMSLAHQYVTMIEDVKNLLIQHLLMKADGDIRNLRNGMTAGFMDLTLRYKGQQITSDDDIPIRYDMGIEIVEGEEPSDEYCLISALSTYDFVEAICDAFEVYINKVNLRKPLELTDRTTFYPVFPVCLKMHHIPICFQNEKLITVEFSLSISY